MFKVCVIAVWTSLLVFVPTAFAEEAASSLPKDGTWVSFNISAKSDDGTLDYSKKITISLVGSARERVGDCRWVELKYVSDTGEETGESVYKCLIPEKALLEAEQPMQRVVRAWVKHRGEEAEELTPAILNGGDPKSFCSLDDEMLFWPGVHRRAKRIAKEKVVKFRDRQLVIPEGLSGKVVREYPSSKLEEKRIETVEYQMWLHADLPLGFAHARIRYVGTGGNPKFPALTTEYTVVDAGVDAKTSLPENN